MTQPTFEEICALGLAEVNGQANSSNPIIAAFNNDEDYIPLCRQIIESSWDNEKLLFFAASHLFDLIKKFSSQWSKEQFIDCSGFLLDCISHTVNINSSYINNACRKFGAALGHIIYMGFNVEESMKNFFGTIMNSYDDSQNDMKLSTLFFIIEYISTIKDPRSQAKDFISNNCLFNIFEYANTVLSSVSQADSAFNEPNNRRLAERALDLIKLCLSYDLRDIAPRAVHRDEIVTEVAEFKSMWKETIIDPQFYAFLFSLTEVPDTFIQKNALNCIYYLCSCKNSMFTTVEESFNVFSEVIEGILRLKNNPQIELTSDLLFNMSKIIYKIRSNIGLDVINQEKDENYAAFIGEIFDLIMKQIEIGALTSRTQAMVYLMKFWCISGNNNPDFNTVYTAYLQALLELPNSEPQDSESEVLNLADCEVIPELISIIPKYDFRIISELSSQLIDYITSFYTELEGAVQKGEGIDCAQKKVGMMILLYAQCIKHIGTSTDDETNALIVQLVFEAIDKIGENIELFAEHDTFYLEQSIIIFIKALLHSVFFRNPKKLAVLPFESFAVLFDFIIRQLNRALRYFGTTKANSSIARLTVEGTIRSALRTLSAHIQYMRKLPMEKELQEATNNALGELLQSICEEPFDFMNSDQKGNIIEMCRIMTDIAVKGTTETINYFQSYLDSVFQLLIDTQSVDTFKQLLYMLIGVFKSCNDKPSFDKFFYWVFPDKLEAIGGLYSDIADDEDGVSLLFQFLFASVQPSDGEKIKEGEKPTKPRRKITFPPHSQNGIRLFADNATIITQAFQFMIEQPEPASSDEYDKKIVKPLKRIFRLMSNILSADYVMFDAFEFYESPILIGMLTGFFELIRKLTTQSLFQYVKLGRELVNLLAALAKKHVKTVTSMSDDIIDMMVKIFNDGLRSSDANVFDSSADAVSLVLKFLADNQLREIVDRNASEIATTAMLVWQYLTNTEKAAVYNASKVLRYVFILFPQLINDIHVASDRFVQTEYKAQFEEVFEKVRQAVESIAHADESMLTNALIAMHRFADEKEMKIDLV